MCKLYLSVGKLFGDKTSNSNVLFNQYDELINGFVIGLNLPYSS